MAMSKLMRGIVGVLSTWSDCLHIQVKLLKAEFTVIRMYDFRKEHERVTEERWDQRWKRKHGRLFLHISFPYIDMGLF